MNKLWLLFLIPVLIFSGCVSDNSAPAADSIVSKVTALTDTVTRHTTVIDALRKDVDNKANKSDKGTTIDDLSKRIDGLPQSGTTGVTKDDMDKAILKAITDLKAGANPWSGSGGSSGTNEGDIISSNGDLELIVERAPGDEEVWINDNIPVEWRLTIKNKASSGTYFRITSNFDTVETSVPIASAILTPSYSQATMLETPNPFSSTSPVSSMSFTSQGSGTDSRVWIPKNSEQSLYLVLKIDYTETTVTGKRWAWDFTIRELH
jgi:hypothetical protein